MKQRGLHMSIKKSLTIGLIGIGLLLSGEVGVPTVHADRPTQTQQAQATVPQPSNPQLTVPQQVAKFKQLLQQNNWVGTALMVRNGQVVYYQAAGYANVAAKIKNTTATQYLINSTQKSMTAVLVMRVIANGQLKLTDRLSRWYPKVPNAKNITIRQMLDMTTGLEGPTATTKQALPAAREANYLSRHLAFNASKSGKWDYQSINYNLLCGIIQKQTGHDYQWWYEHEFVKPLALKQTSFSYQQSLTKSPRLAIGYAGNPKTNTIEYRRTKTTDFMPGKQTRELGSGNLYMSPLDLFRAEAAICTGRIVSTADVNQLRTPGSTSSYGGGVYNRPTGYVIANGIGYGFSDMFVISNDGQNGLVLLSNLWRPKGQDQMFFYRLSQMEAFHQW